MAWIPSDIDMSGHPKITELSRQLGVEVPTALGHLHMFWHYAMKYFSNGDITNANATDVTNAVMWRNKDVVFLNVLIKCRFVDEVGGHLLVHDWHEYGGKLLETKTANAERQAKYRDRQKANEDKAAKEKRVKKKAADSESVQAENSSNGDITKPLHNNNSVQYSTEEKSTKEKSTNGVVRASAENDAPPPPEKSSSSQDSKYPNMTPDRKKMLDAVLAILEKSIEWDMSQISNRHERTIAKIMNKLETDGRTLTDLEVYKTNFVTWLNRGPDVDPPTPDQMLSDFDMILKYKRQENDAKPKLPIRAAHNDASLKRYIERKKERLANGQSF